MSVKIMSVGEAEKKAKEYLEEDNEDSLFDLADQLLSQNEVYGSANDFHNFSLNYSRIDAYVTACDILEKGLEQFPKSVDLLADFLQVGINCKKSQECDMYYQRLLSIPMKRWTWRGFSFLIDYMLFLADDFDDQKLDEWKTKLIKITDDYQHYFTLDEDPYVCKADIYRYYNSRDEERNILEEAVEKVPVCPKCSLRLADMLFECGEYKEALEVIDGCLYKSIQTQDSVNHGYLYYLSGLCKVVRVSKNNHYSNNEAIIDIYHDFSIAQKSGLNYSSYLKVIQRQIDILETKSGLSFDNYI